jgi:hypothetical protein
VSNVQALTPGPAGGPPWSVVSVTETTDQDATGRYAKGKAVTFQLGSGAMGTVFVPNANWTPDTVKALINQAAANLHAVTNLTDKS